jgi:hypothetical protein
MANIIFAQPRHVYQSYSDYWRLVELAGYPIVYLDEMDLQSDNCYIFSTPSTFWHDGVEGCGFEGARARLIYNCLEFYLDVDYPSIPGVEVWTPDAWYAKFARIRYVPMGSDVALNLLPDARPSPRYVATLWAESGHRYTAYGSMVNAGLKMGLGGWGEARHQNLLSAAVMVHAHQWVDRPTIAPQRWALAAAYHLPLITEYLGDAGIFNGLVLETSAEAMGFFVREHLQPVQRGLMNKYADRLHEQMCVKMPFKKGIEAAV